MLAVRRDDPHAFRARHVDVAPLVELHPVDELAARRIRRCRFPPRNNAAVRERMIGAESKTADVGVHRVIDVQLRLVRREAEAVRLGEIVDQELQVSAARRQAVDALEVEFLLAFEAEAGHPPVRRIGEDNRTVGGDDDVVRAVQLAIAPVSCNRLARPVRRLAHQRAGDVLADDQVPVVVARHPVALVARVA